MSDGNALSERGLEFSLWYVKHKVLLRRVLLGLMVAIDAAFLAYTVFGAGRDLVLIPSRKKYEFELLRAQLPSNPLETSRPQDLQLGGVELLHTGGAADVLARVRNPNPQWYVRFNYTIGLGDKVENAADGFLLPGEERPFFKTFRTRASGTVVFNIENVSWRRIRGQEAADFESWKAERIRFEVTGAQFLPALDGDKGGLSRATFTVTNNSAYSYLAPKFLVLLYRGSRLVAIQGVVVDRFQTGEARQVEVSWFDRIGAVSNIEVVPEIDIMNPEVYLAPEG